MKRIFIIIQVNNQAVKTVNKLVNILENYKGGIMFEGIYEDIPGIYYYAVGL
jgi:serine protease Do